MTVDSLAVLLVCCCCTDDNDADADDMWTSAGCTAVNVDDGCDVSIGACSAVVSTAPVAEDGDEDATGGISVAPADGTGDDAANAGA